MSGTPRKLRTSPQHLLNVKHFTTSEKHPLPFQQLSIIILNLLMPTLPYLTLSEKAMLNVAAPA
jgi:hypothetical protein